MFRSAAFVVIHVCIVVAGCVEDNNKSPILFSKFVCALCQHNYNIMLVSVTSEYIYYFVRVCMFVAIKVHPLGS